VWKALNPIEWRRRGDCGAHPAEQDDFDGELRLQAPDVSEATAMLD